MSCGSFKKADVVCPFFKKDRVDKKNGMVRQIACEGIIDNSTVRLCFQNHKDYYFYIDTYCCKNYKYCEVYRMIKENRYPDD